MLRVLRALVLVMGIAGLAGPAFAKPVVYTCHNSSNRNASFLAGQVQISYDAETKQVLVTDDAILSMQGKPLEGKLKSENAKRIVFSWVLRNAVNSAGQTATLQYMGTYYKADGKFQISMIPLGYRDVYTDQGNCTVK